MTSNASAVVIETTAAVRRGDGLQRTTLPLALDAGSLALLLVDVYGVGVDLPGEGLDHLAEEQARVLRAEIVPLRAAAHAAGIPVVFTANAAPNIELDRSAYGRQRLEHIGIPLSRLLREEGTTSPEYLVGSPALVRYAPEIEPTDDEYLVRKHTYSSFFGTRLDVLLRSLGTKTLLVAGFYLDVCVLSTCLDALFLNYGVVLVRDATLPQEFAEDRGGPYRDRMVKWFESLVGRTALRQAVTEGLDQLARRNRPAGQGGGPATDGTQGEPAAGPSR